MHKGRPCRAGISRRAARVRRDGGNRRRNQHRCGAARALCCRVRLRWCGRRCNRRLQAGRRIDDQAALDDFDDRKLEWAQEFGATHVCNSATTDPVEFIRSVTDGNGADVCIEAIGHPEVYKQCFEARDLAGTVVLVGVPNPEMTVELPFIEIFGRGGALKSSWYGDCLPERDFPMLIDLYLQGRLDLGRFVSETIGLSDVEQAFHNMEQGEVLRSVVVL